MNFYVQYQNATNLQRVIYGDNYDIGGLALQDGGLFLLEDGGQLLLENSFGGLAEYLTIDPLEFYYNYYNLSTANTQGLDNWGRILQVSRTIYVPDYTQVFGFGEGLIPDPIDTGYPQNFEHGSFYGGQTTPVILSDAQYRAVLQFRFSCLNTNMSLASINAIMNSYFQAQNSAYKVRAVQESTMQLIYYFNFGLQDFERTMFKSRSLLPAPLGVETYVLENQIF